jgi:hypothetical protein
VSIFDDREPSWNPPPPSTTVPEKKVRIAWWRRGTDGSAVARRLHAQIEA